jgi:hypothetical protein
MGSCIVSSGSNAEVSKDCAGRLILVLSLSPVREEEGGGKGRIQESMIVDCRFVLRVYTTDYSTSYYMSSYSKSVCLQQLYGTVCTVHVAIKDKKMIHDT